MSEETTGEIVKAAFVLNMVKNRQIELLVALLETEDAIQEAGDDNDYIQQCEERLRELKRRFQVGEIAMKELAECLALLKE